MLRLMDQRIDKKHLVGEEDAHRERPPPRRPQRAKPEQQDRPGKAQDRQRQIQPVRDRKVRRLFAGRKRQLPPDGDVC